jgi:hypothetical protein
MAGIGQNIFTHRPTINANYDWIDLVSATGQILFYGLNAVDSVGDNYTLIPSDAVQSVYGADLATTVAVTKTQVTGNSGTSFDKDFDLSAFQLPRTIEGTGLVRVSLRASGVQVDGIVITALLRKWDGATETEVASISSDTFALGAGSETSRTLKLTIPRTHYKKDEQIRLTIRVATTDNDVYLVAHSPQDAALTGAFSAANSRLAVVIPFKLDFL